MRICFLADALAEHTRRWTRYFAQRGHEVTLITWNPRVLPGYAPVEVRVVRKPHAMRAANGVAIVRELRRILPRGGFDLLHAHSSCAYAWAGAAARFHPLVVTPWGTDLLELARRSRLAGFLTGRALRAADCVTCDAEHIRREIETYRVAPERIHIVMFGVDLARFSPDAQVRAAMRRRHGLDGRTVILSTRTHSPVHDVMTLVRAVPELRGHAARPFFVIAADGMDRPKLEAEAAALGVREDTLFAGYLSENEMADWLRAADIYVSTSLADAGIAASTAEAMAMGLAPVITEFGDNGDWVRHGENGLLFEAGAPAQLAASLALLLDSPALRERFGARSRGIVRERCNYEIEMARMERIYERLCGRAERTAAARTVMSGA